MLCTYPVYDMTAYLLYMVMHEFCTSSTWFYTSTRGSVFVPRGFKLVTRDSLLVPRDSLLVTRDSLLVSHSLPVYWSHMVLHKHYSHGSIPVRVAPNNWYIIPRNFVLVPHIIQTYSSRQFYVHFHLSFMTSLYRH